MEWGGGRKDEEKKGEGKEGMSIPIFYLY